MEPEARVVSAKSLTTAFQVVLTAYAFGTLRINMIHLVNTSAADVTVRLCFVPLTNPVTAPAAANAVLWDFNVPANDFLEFGEGDHLAAYTSIQALASVDNAINIRVAGVQEA